MARTHTINNILIVLLFALLHFAVALISRTLHYYDDIPLTVLTIAMVIVISIRNNMRIEMMAILTLVATLFGFVVGSWLWQPIERLLSNSVFAPAISTLLITTVSGLAIESFSRRTKRYHADNRAWRPSALNVVGIAMSILILRMSYIVMSRAEIFTEGELVNNMLTIMGNTWSVLLLIVGNILIVMYTPKLKWSVVKHYPIISVLVLSAITIPAMVAAIVYLDTPIQTEPAPNGYDFLATLLAALLFDVFIVTAFVLVRYSTLTRSELLEERELKRRSEYQYERLKQQINPHFLFNSLGILDYLVQEHETERASAFIRKLAGMYRYMLKNDQKPLIKLSEEIEFTQMYIDLLQERFTSGMVVDIDIDKGLNDKYVVPCAVQLLVENATKHNIVSAEQPLTIKIGVEEGMLVVRNTLQLRTHGQPSTHLGLKNIRHQYIDITHRGIIIEKTDTEFIVKLPII
ncbi:MAG: histidine kinase [Alistipes sp.]|nr:histidine kinase [Alistipes sp.]